MERFLEVLLASFYSVRVLLQSESCTASCSSQHHVAVGLMVLLVEYVVTGHPTTRVASLALGAGFGLGMAYTECSKDFETLLDLER